MNVVTGGCLWRLVAREEGGGNFPDNLTVSKPNKGKTMNDSVKPPTRRKTGTPDYTPEQKAAAFDALWEHCGPGRGVLNDWVDLPVSRAAHEATFRRVPRYKFEIMACGEGMLSFRDVLHHMATRDGA